MVGNDDEFDNYFKEFISRTSTPSHNQYSFGPGVKIGDAKTIKKILSSRTDHSRVILLKGKITLEAQNALLKSIEELPEDTFLLIYTNQRGDLLPTVVSRCSLVHLSAKTSYEELPEMDNYFSNPDLTTALKASSNLAGYPNGAELLLSYLVKKIGTSSEKTNKEQKLLVFIANKIYLYLTFKNNNLNQKMALDNIFFAGLKLSLDKDK